MLFYRACLPLPRRTLNLAARTIRAHRAQSTARWWRLDAARQALLVLVHLHKGETFAEPAAAFTVGTATAWRHVRETTGPLARRTRSPEAALRRVRRAGWAYVIVDGTLIAGDRVASDRPFYSGKHKRHGRNIQVLPAPDGALLWVSGRLLGSVHDAGTARTGLSPAGDDELTNSKHRYFTVSGGRRIPVRPARNRGREEPGGARE